MPDIDQLRLAVHCGDHFTVQKLLQQELDWSEADADGGTVLHDACADVYPVVVSHLLESGMFDVNAPGRNGFTPLHLATGIAAVESYGFQSRTRGGSNDDDEAARAKAWRSAVERSAVLCVRLLRTHGAFVDAKNRWGETPLNCAKEIGFVAVCEELQTPPGQNKLDEYRPPVLFVNVRATGEIFASEVLTELETAAVNLDEVAAYLKFLEKHGGSLACSLPPRDNQNVSENAKLAQSLIVRAWMKGVNRIKMPE